MISTFKRHVCPRARDEDEEEKLKYPDKDIWTRVIIESETSLWNFFFINQYKFANSIILLFISESLKFVIFSTNSTLNPFY